MEQIVLATSNQGKIRELSELLAPLGIRVRSLAEFENIGEIEETGETFEENAFIKARAVAAATGFVAVADDSGLEVDALGGAPGVRTARFAGENATDEENWKKLLHELKGLPEPERAARFVCVMAASSPGGTEISARGEWEGVIADAPAGEGGFGYDPVFRDRELSVTNAQLSREEKNARSHRGRAIQGLLAQWPDFWEKTRT